MSKAEAVVPLLQTALQHQRAGQLFEAESCYRQLLAQVPQHPDALHGLGLLAHMKGDYAQAGELMRAALAAFDRDGAEGTVRAPAQSNLGCVYLALGAPAQALECFKRAIRLAPRYAPAYYNLGNAYADQLDYEAAIESYSAALRLQPGNAEAHYNLALAYRQFNRLDEAIASCQQVLRLRPGFARAYVTLGSLYLARYDVDEAVGHLIHALVLQPESIEALINLGDAYISLGWVEKSLECYQRVVTLQDQASQGRVEQPDPVLTFDSRLFTLLYLPATTALATYEEHCRYAAQFEAPLLAAWPVHRRNRRDPGRRLKVGYVSADLRLHAVAYFMEPLLAHHDRDEVEVTCYYNNSLEDEVTERLKGYANHWIACKAMTDEALAARIQSDGIDILVDLAGHTAGNRLLVFARKPAPVQVTYLGYVATTGLTAIDYRLSHIDADPEGSERYNSERLYRLPRSLWCYRPPLDMPAVEPVTPARRNGHITFGSLNNIAKVSDSAVALWSRLLHALPGSRLIMAGVPLGTAQLRIHARFAVHGIAAARIELHPKLSHWSFRELHHRIDIALDSFPYNGNTTTCESLWMGVPVLSLIGDRFVARFGYLLLKTIGLAELAAHDEAEYLVIATALARDLDRLDALRGGMRARIESSALRDEAGFTRDLEAAYRVMWQAWCRKTAGRDL